MIERTEENIDKLAKTVIYSWDMDRVLQYALDVLKYTYLINEEAFQEDWSKTFISTEDN